MKNCLCMRLVVWMIIFGNCFIAQVYSQDNTQPEGFKIKEYSDYVENIDTQDYKEIPPPKTPILFRWDFSDAKKYSYNYDQKVVMQNLMSGFGPNSRDSISSQNISGNGILSYKSEKNKTARFVLENLLLKSEFLNDNGEKPPKTMEMKSPPMVVQGVKEDGNLSISSSSQTLLLKLLFPLPNKPMRISDTIDIEANMPFNAMGSLLHVKGYSRITLTKYVQINGHRCAKLVSNIDISKLEIPPELKGKFIVYTKGKSVFYFDIDDRKFISRNLALLMVMDIETKSPQMSFPDDEQAEQQPEAIKMAMNSDNLITLNILDR